MYPTPVPESVIDHLIDRFSYSDSLGHRIYSTLIGNYPQFLENKLQQGRFVEKVLKCTEPAFYVRMNAFDYVAMRPTTVGQMLTEILSYPYCGRDIAGYRLGVYQAVFLRAFTEFRFHECLSFTQQPLDQGYPPKWAILNAFVDRVRELAADPQCQKDFKTRQKMLRQQVNQVEGVLKKMGQSEPLCGMLFKLEQKQGGNFKRFLDHLQEHRTLFPLLGFAWWKQPGLDGLDCLQVLVMHRYYPLGRDQEWLNSLSQEAVSLDAKITQGHYRLSVDQIRAFLKVSERSEAIITPRLSDRDVSTFGCFEGVEL